MSLSGRDSAEQSQSLLLEMMTASNAGNNRIAEIIQELIQREQHEVLINIFKHINIHMDKKAATQRINLDEIITSPVTKDTAYSTHLAAARLALASKPTPDENILLGRIKFEILTAIFEYITAKTNPHRQEYIDVVRKYGSDADQLLCDDIGIPPATGVIGSVKGAIGVVGDYVGKLNDPTERTNADIKESRNKVHHQTVKSLLGSREKTDSLRTAIEMLLIADEYAAAKPGLDVQKDEASSGVSFEDYLLKNFDDTDFNDKKVYVNNTWRLAMANLKNCTNHELLKLAAKLEECDHLITSIRASIMGNQNLACHEKLTLIRILQIANDTIAIKKQSKIAAEMYQRLHYLKCLDNNIFIKLDTCRHAHEFVLPCKAINLVKTGILFGKNKSTDEFHVCSPMLVSLTIDAAKKGERALDTLNPVLISKFIYYIGEAGTEEQRSQLLMQQPAMLPQDTEKACLDECLKEWNIECGDAFRKFLVSNILDKNKGLIVTYADLYSLREILVCMASFQKNKALVIQTIFNAVGKNIFNTNQQFKAFSQEVKNFICLDQDESRANILHKITELSGNSEQFFAVTQAYRNIKDKDCRKLFDRLFLSATNDHEPLHRQIIHNLNQADNLFGLVAAVENYSDLKRLIAMIMDKFNPITDSDLLYVLRCCATPVDVYERRLSAVFFINCVAEAKSIFEFFKLAVDTSTTLRNHQLLDILYNHLDKEHVCQLLNRALGEKDNATQDLKSLIANQSRLPYLQSMQRAAAVLQDLKLMNAQEFEFIADNTLLFTIKINEIINCILESDTRKITIGQLFNYFNNLFASVALLREKDLGGYIKTCYDDIIHVSKNLVLSTLAAKQAIFISLAKFICHVDHISSHQQFLIIDTTINLYLCLKKCKILSEVDRLSSMENLALLLQKISDPIADKEYIKRLVIALQQMKTSSATKLAINTFCDNIAAWINVSPNPMISANALTGSLDNRAQRNSIFYRNKPVENGDKTARQLKHNT